MCAAALHKETNDDTKRREKCVFSRSRHRILPAALLCTTPRQHQTRAAKRAASPAFTEIVAQSYFSLLVFFHLCAQTFLPLTRPLHFVCTCDVWIDR